MRAVAPRHPLAPLRLVLQVMNYELYHDESQVGGYWHGMLLVPDLRKEELVRLLMQARELTHHNEPIGIKGVEEFGRVYGCANAWVQIGVAALMSRMKGVPYPLYMGERARGRYQYSFFAGTIGAKFILFRERDQHSTMTGHHDYGSKVETTFRMGLKGGIHSLGDDGNPISITRMHFDGHQHYGRHLDRQRIVDRLTGLREYCAIDCRSDLIDDRSGDHKRAGAQDYEDCQLLQLTDLLIGCFRTALGQYTRDIHIVLAMPVKQLVKRYSEGHARMLNSRWCNSFWISQCFLENGAWKFNMIDWRLDYGRQLELPPPGGLST